MKRLNIFLILICFISIFCFAGCDDKKNKSLSVPSGISFEEENIIFSPVSDAEYYKISINDFEVIVDPNHNTNISVVDGKYVYDASKIFRYGENYVVKVQACSSERKDSNYSPSFVYRYAVGLTTPKNVKINATTLTWDAVENATYYVVKMITPYDDIVLDKQGNIITIENAQSVENADLQEYYYTSNNLDFNSILTSAGEYQFYVKAVNVSDNVVNYSPYTEKVSYKYIKELATPINFAINQIEGVNVKYELHLTSAIDENATHIAIKFEDKEKIVPIKSADSYVEYVDNNVKNFVDINLSKIFRDDNISFEDCGDYKFQTKVLVEGEDEEKTYLDSSYSDEISFSLKEELESPEFEIVFDSLQNSYVANILNEIENASGYRIFVGNADGVNSYDFSAASSLILNSNALFVSVQSLGSGYYKNSNISVPKSINHNVIEESTNVRFDVNTNRILWTNYNNQSACYILDLNNAYEVVDDIEKDITDYIFENKSVVANIIYVQNSGDIVYDTLKFNYSKSLDVPTTEENQGFSTTQQFLYTFTGVKDAVGYYCYIKSPNETDFRRIDKLYTQTTIDLSQYMESVGNYKITMQAVANPHSFNSNSGESLEQSFDKIIALPKPEFYKIENKVAPIVKTEVGDTTSFFVWFYGVNDAYSYEVLVNNNLIIVPHNISQPDNLYKVEISSLMTSAKVYTIKVRAIANPNQNDITSSEKISYDYHLFKQLSSVENIQVNFKDGKYTLTFNPVNNADSYNVKIVKFNDDNYREELNEKGLSPEFNTISSYDITQYVEQAGNYIVYLTALAKQGGFYTDSNISTNFKYVDESGQEFETINKVKSLKTPSNITFESVSKDEYILSWDGDENADYYLIRLIDKAGYTYEFIETNTSANINKYMTIEGIYKVSIYSKVDIGSENASVYISSSNGDDSVNYSYEKPCDFERYKVYLYGNKFDFVVKNSTDLKNILWYDLLYSNSANSVFKLYLDLQENETVTSAVNRLISEASSIYYDFENDEYWINRDEETDADLGSGLKYDGSTDEKFAYLTKIILNLYPDMAFFNDPVIERASDDSQIYVVKFYNKLNTAKVAPNDSAYTFDYNNYYIQSNTSYVDYGNNNSYLKPSARRRADFETENEKTGKEVLVSSTEQLLQAVLNDAKPKFYGDFEVAKTVYENAKLVLSAIVLDSMTETEKAIAIFDWIEYALNYDNFANQCNRGKVGSSYSLPQDEDLEIYGLREEFYLEGIFYHLTDASVGNYDGEFYFGKKLGTKNLYSKAFAFLCHMEGIDARIIYDLDKYSASENLNSEDEEEMDFNPIINHIWNKFAVKINGEKVWYDVDLTLSDNSMNLTKVGGKDMFTLSSLSYSSHTYFMTVMPNLLKSNENLIYDNAVVMADETNAFDYFNTSKYSLTKLTYNTYYGSNFGKTTSSSFDVKKKYDSSSNETRQAYLTKACIIADYYVFNKNKIYDDGESGTQKGYATIEISTDWTENEVRTTLAEIFTTHINHFKSIKNCGVEKVGNVIILKFSK